PTIPSGSCPRSARPTGRYEVPSPESKVQSRTKFIDSPLATQHSALSTQHSGLKNMTRSIFVNTTGWLALYNPNDPNHDAVVQLWEDLRRAPGEPARFVCTDYVLDQVFTALKV